MSSTPNSSFGTPKITSSSPSNITSPSNAAASTTQNTDASNTTTSLSSEISILPQLMHVLQAIKEGKDELELARSVNALNERFHKCNKLIDELPGVNLTNQQQQQMYSESIAKLNAKCELIEKYKRLAIYNPTAQ